MGLPKNDRRILNPDWTKLDFSQTDQALNIPAPDTVKPYDKNSILIGLVPKDEWKIKDVSVEKAILNRESRRKFKQDELTPDELSFLLYATQGVRINKPKFTFRSVPSGGARHTFETYLFIDRVSGIQKGLYRYLPLEHKLFLEEAYHDNMADQLNKALRGQLWNAAVYFLWTTIPYRMEWRYSFVSTKIIAIDAGHLCQNLYIACEAIDAGTCGIGAYDQKLMDAFLKADGENEFAVYMAPVGKV
jgi:SagB-type dehydrogenase family enzyme